MVMVMVMCYDGYDGYTDSDGYVLWWLWWDFRKLTWQCWFPPKERGWGDSAKCFEIRLGMKHFIKKRLALYIYLFVLYFYLDLNISFYLELNNQMKILVHPSLQLSSLGTLPPHSLRLITVHNIYSAQYHHTKKPHQSQSPWSTWWQKIKVAEISTMVAKKAIIW